MVDFLQVATSGVNSGVPMKNRDVQRRQGTDRLGDGRVPGTASKQCFAFAGSSSLPAPGRSLSERRRSAEGHGVAPTKC